MEQLIKEHTIIAKNIKSKKTELNEIQQKIDDINNTHLFEMTFDKFKDKSLLIEYYETQSTRLANYQNAIRNGIWGTLNEQIAEYIEEQADDNKKISEAFDAFEAQPNDGELKENYYNSFNNKVAVLYKEALELLQDYLETLDENEQRRLKKGLKYIMPKPRSIVDIETKKESDKLGIPFSYRKR